MMLARHICLILFVLFARQMVMAQTFVNGDLEGTVDYVSVPPGWDFIPFTDLSCQATSTLEATVDVLDATGPSFSGGIAGIPNSGNTFVSGLHANSGAGQLWHEGLMQTVNGFTVGNNYTISIFQAVVKQNNCIDPSGSWRVYLDNNLIATTAISTSYLLPADVNLNWEERFISFIATATSHTIKFIPWDDDANLLTSVWDTTGAIRMGIDNVSFVPDPPEVYLGPDTLLCVGQSLLLNASYPGSNYLWQDGSTDSTFLVTQSGTYWVTVTNSYGSDSDTITVNFESPDQAELGPDITLCIGDSVVLSNNTPSSSYLWSDNSTGSELLVSESGTYWLALTSFCGTTIDSIVIEEVLCEFILKMPNVFTPNADANNDHFLPIEANYIDSYNLTVFNRWGNIVFHTLEQNVGWNGLVNDTEAPEGVYTWKIVYEDLDGKKGEMHGLVHLIR